MKLPTFNKSKVTAIVVLTLLFLAVGTLIYFIIKKQIHRGGGGGGGGGGENEGPSTPLVPNRKFANGMDCVDLCNSANVKFFGQDNVNKCMEMCTLVDQLKACNEYYCLNNESCIKATCHF